jgi:hypothetical protein
MTMTLRRHPRIELPAQQLIPASRRGIERVDLLSGEGSVFLERGETIEDATEWKAEPRLMEIAVFLGVGTVLFLATILHFKSYASVVRTFGDNGAYISAASTIRHWDFQGFQVKQFLGYSYAMASVAAITGMPVGACLLFVSILSSLVSVVLTFRLWGGRVAAFFAITNFEWMQRSFLGGAEPLFVLLLFASFLAVRSERWKMAAGFAAFATITRPLGIFALVAIGAVLLWRREFRKVLSCVTIAAGVGMLYVLPFWLYLGDPLYQIHRYQTSDWHSGSSIGLPLVSIVQSVIHNQQPWTNLVPTLSWTIFAFVGLLMLAFRRKSAAHKFRVEWLFAIFYVVFLLCYNSPQWARADFPRFIIPVAPLLFMALWEWLPRDRRILWAISLVSPTLAAASALGVRNVISALH